MTQTIQSICAVSWFDERDIDVLLAEELRINGDFSRWFLDQLQQSSRILTPAYQTRISVMDDAGRETDVEALFHISGGGIFAVLVEDKIKAGFQPNQMEDYLDRGERGRRLGKWTDFAVVVFAPSYRGLSIPKNVRVLRFEDAAHALRDMASSDQRLLYRSQFLERAAQPNAVVVETENPFVVEWWTAIDQMANREFGDFFVVDRKRFPKTTYVNLKCTDMPAYLRLDLKGTQGEVALAFIGFPEEVLRSLVLGIEPKVADVAAKRGQDPTLLIGGLQKFQVSDGMDAVNGPALLAYQAAHTLLSFWKDNRIRFDEAANRFSKNSS